MRNISIRSMFLLFVIVGILSACSADSSIDGNVVAQTTQDQTIDREEDPDKVQIYYFWGDGCPFCAEQRKWLDDVLKEEFDDEIQVIDFETYGSRENSDMMQEIASTYGIEARGVPITFIGDEYWRGFNAGSIGPQMIDKVEECIQEGCESPGKRLDRG